MKRDIQIFLFGLCLGIGTIFFYEQRANNTNGALLLIRPFRSQANTYAFIDPLLAYELPPATEFGEFLPLKKTLTNYAAEQKRLGMVTDVSIYVRDLKSGRWIGVDEDQQYAPASLYKLPVLFTYFKESEKNPEVLSLKAAYYSADGTPQDPTPLEFIPGKLFTVETLIRDMMVYSNNVSFNILLRGVDRKIIRNVFEDLGITYPGDETSITPKDYALFLRVLYNATYLERDTSEKALRLMSEARFDKGLSAGVPNDIVIAHKFGVRMRNWHGRDMAELHDCGIVYYPKKPYLLCIFTRGERIGILEDFLKNTSRFVYEYYHR